nr:DEAD/DEAH box helicase [uncultured Butyrivibrio sp.]
MQKEEKKQAKLNEFETAQGMFPKTEFDYYWKKNAKKVAGKVCEALKDALATNRLYVNVSTQKGFSTRQELCFKNIKKFCSEFAENVNDNIIHEVMPDYVDVLYNIFMDTNNPDILAFLLLTPKKTAMQVIFTYLWDNRQDDFITEYIRTNLTEMDIHERLLQNDYYSDVAGKINKDMRAKKLLYKNIKKSTPTNFTKMFPETREMTRKFILHIGPTNSGKTYNALEDLKNAKSGVYLAPLRLLAYEQYEKMNKEGCPCSMITGEEMIIMPGSFHQSSTIEMLNLHEEYDVAVIDEAQMIADSQRGGAWTSAILGVRASTVHLCASPDAEKALIRMITSCQDEYKVVYHERKTQLMQDPDAAHFSFPQDVKEGDALIVFSRKDVHSVAEELKNHGIGCSIIYGSLPYEVRHREATKFADGVTKVVVATDAIGMGMNLPIRRVVFLQTSKYDGTRERPLNVSELKQIAGRAGRYGLYDIGYFTSTVDYMIIGKLVNYDAPLIRKAMINIPEDFLNKEGRVSTILEMWNQIPQTGFYVKGDVSDKIRLARLLEEISDDKELVKTFVKIPLSLDSKELFNEFMKYFRITAKGETPDLSKTLRRYNPISIDVESEDALQQLETYSTIYDFLYSYSRATGNDSELDMILIAKRDISEKIFQILDKQGFIAKTCTRCGKKLIWSHKGNLCDACYENRKIRR